MSQYYDLNNTGPQVQDRLDQTQENKQDIATLEEKVTAIENEIGESGQGGNTINARLDALETAVGSGGSVDERIAAAETEIIGGASSDYNTLGKVEGELEDTYRKNETYSKTELDNLITTPNVLYVTVIATNGTTDVTTLLPATGAADTVYRVGNWDGTQYDTTVYALYAWNGSAYVCLSVRSFVGEVYDVSVNHPDGQGNPTPYADLTAALGTGGANIPADIRRGGMSIKFIQGTVQSNDNKYVQYFCTAQNFTTDVTQWQGVDDEPTAGSNNLVKSGGVFDRLQLLNNQLSFNQFDEVLELGGYSTDGEKTGLTDRLRTKNYMKVTPNEEMYFNVPSTSSFVRLCYYNSEKVFIGYSDQTGFPKKLTIPQNASYIRFNLSSSYGTTYLNDICINYDQPNLNVSPHNGEYLGYGIKEVNVFTDVTKLKAGLDDISNDVETDGIQIEGIDKNVFNISEPYSLNLFDERSLLVNGVSVENGVYTGTANAFMSAFGNTTDGLKLQGGFIENQRYTLSLKIKNNGPNFDSGYGIRFSIYYTDDTTRGYSVDKNQSTFNTITLISEANKTINKLCIEAVSNANNSWSLKEVQIEKGTSASPFTQYVPVALDRVARQGVETAMGEITTVNGNLFYAPNVPNFKNCYIRYSDGHVQNSNSSKCYMLENDGITRIKFKSSASSTSIASIAFFTSRVPSESTYLKSASIQATGQADVQYEAVVPSNAVLICLTAMMTDETENPIFVPIYDNGIYRTVEDVRGLYKLQSNPYAGISWGTVKDVTSTSHAHCVNQYNFDVLKAHYEHLAISNYHPAVPAYPLSDFFENVGNLIGCPNTEQSAFLNSQFPKTHLNPIGSILVGGEGFYGTEKDMQEDSLKTRLYACGGGITINHPVWSEITLEGMKRLIAMPGVIAMEIYNATCARLNLGYALDLWDAILSENIQIYGTAVPDHEAQSYDETDLGYGYNHLLVNAKTEFECLSAYRMGHFYTTEYNDGLLLESYVLASNTLSVEVSEQSTFKFITAKRTVEVNTASTSASFSVTEDDVYVRCEATRGRNILRTNAIML